MYNILVHAHSGWRWIVLILIVAAIVQAYRKWKAGNRLTNANRKLAMFAMIATHIQLLLGLLLYIMDSKNKVQFNGDMISNSMLRFYTVEHILVMFIGIGLIMVGHKKAKRIQNFKPIFWYYLIALVLMLSRIPWPGQFADVGWF